MEATQKQPLAEHLIEHLRAEAKRLRRGWAQLAERLSVHPDTLARAAAGFPLSTSIRFLIERRVEEWRQCDAVAGAEYSAPAKEGA